jgi:hypothetical protein
MDYGKFKQIRIISKERFKNNPQVKFKNNLVITANYGNGWIQPNDLGKVQTFKLHAIYKFTDRENNIVFSNYNGYPSIHMVEEFI